jgi:Domain of unknown function (DUF4126)
MDSSLLKLLPEIALAAALAWGAGLRLYAVLFLVGLAGRLGWVELPDHLALLTRDVVLAASGFMMAVEFFADKLPWLDSLWDAIHTVIRIPAGAALAAAVFGDSGTGVMLAAAILGGTLSTGSHLTKAGARGAINASPEPFTNWGLSLGEDAAVPAGLWLAFAHPAVFLLAIALFAVAAFFLWRRIARGLARLLARKPRAQAGP